MSKEWYLEEYEKKTYLHNKELTIFEYPHEEGTHDHCELCWARFSIYPCDLQNGYYEPSSKSLICPKCYNSFSSLFGWRVKT